MGYHREGLGAGREDAGTTAGYRYGEACGSTFRAPVMPEFPAMLSLTGWAAEFEERLGVLHNELVKMQDYRVLVAQVKPYRVDG